jgi:hypothetical protein
VKYWIHELHFKKFGNVIGEKTIDFTPAEREDFCEGPAPIYREESWAMRRCFRQVAGRRRRRTVLR